MINFIKRNAKTVVISAISLVLIAGLSAALIVTNVGTANARGRDRNRSDNRSDRVARAELTEEQLAERMALRIERLEQRLEDGKITQEEFDEYKAALESGEYPEGEKTRSGKSHRNKNPDRVREHQS